MTREKLPVWKKGRADRGLGCGENETICLRSNVIRIGEEDTTKRKNRIVQGQEPKSAGKKMTRKKSERKSPLVFPVSAF